MVSTTKRVSWSAHPARSTTSGRVTVNVEPRPANQGNIVHGANHARSLAFIEK